MIKWSGNQGAPTLLAHYLPSNGDFDGGPYDQIGRRGLAPTSNHEFIEAKAYPPAEHCSKAFSRVDWRNDVSWSDRSALVKTTDVQFGISGYLANAKWSTKVNVTFDLA